MVVRKRWMSLRKMLMQIEGAFKQGTITEEDYRAGLLKQRKKDGIMI